MTYGARPDNVTIHEGRYVPPITRDDHEIVMASTLDDAIMFFVVLPKAKMQQAHARPAPTEPLDEDNETT